MILTRGARATGAVLSALLAVIVACWLIRDVRATSFGQLWRYWAGFNEPGLWVMPATSAMDVVLFVVYVAVAVASLRTAVAAPALVAAGVVTIGVRLPGLWTIGNRRMESGYSDDLRSRALICVFVALAAGAAMIITAGAGRRPPADSYEPLPTRPGPGAGVLAFLALGAAGAVLIAWEIRQMARYPELFPEWYTGGDRIGQQLTGAPAGWGAVLLALLCLFCGISAVARATHARPFGLIAAVLLLPGAVLGVMRIVHFEMFDHFDVLPGEMQLTVLSWMFQGFAAVAALIALAVPGGAGAPGPGREPWGGGPGWGPGQAAPPYPAQQPPGYGYPQGGGGFGPPPPPSQPPPGW
ncbi:MULTISPECIES: hypothetical protein [unclassified Streptomyces]|uniref:hypothetical protein n=1 Tax=unclassified Streptomyces TaxID=2593676 RepID=UPI000DAD4270|nr:MULTISPECIES: hypothetical protein [unclassified Streptomyces]PZT76465.1 hypothetical protein DNK56_24350 [Streptomyces sp. AC1-42W]PZT79579.1 hypothetical protein DNK55_08315 [Streptomyces sp. AC1-42T]